MYNPVILFTCIFLFSYLMSLLRLSSQIGSFSFLTHSVVIFSILSFFLSYFIGRNYKLKRKTLSFTVNRKFLHISFIISSISMSLLIYEYALVGIPIFNDIELDRFKVQDSGYLHILAMLFKPLLSIYMTILFTLPYFNIKKADIIIIRLISTVGLLLLLVSGSRGHVALVLLVSTIATVIIRNINIRKLFFIGIFFILFLSFGKHYRDLLFYGDNYLDSIANVWFFGENYAYLYAGYMTFAMNFEILDRMINSLTDHEIGYGYYLLMPIISIWPGRQETLEDMQNRIWNNDFHGGLTNTYLGTPYADFGVIGVVLVAFIFGIASKYIYIKMVINQTFKSILIYAYWLHILMLSIYTYPFAQLHGVLYFIVFVLALNMIKTKETN